MEKKKISSRRAKVFVLTSLIYPIGPPLLLIILVSLSEPFGPTGDNDFPGVFLYSCMIVFLMYGSMVIHLVTVIPYNLIFLPFVVATLTCWKMAFRQKENRYFITAHILMFCVFSLPTVLFFFP